MSDCEATMDPRDDAILHMLRRRITSREIAARLELSESQLNHRIYHVLKAKRPPVAVKKLKHLNLYIDAELLKAAAECAKHEGLSMNRYISGILVDALEKRGYPRSSGLSGRRTTK